MINFDLHKLFRVARETQDINQKKIASAVGIAAPSLSNFEKGKKGKNPLSKETLKKIAPLLSINPEYVSDQTQNPIKSNNLVKMFFLESMFGKIDFDFIRFLYSKNGRLSILFLYAPVAGLIKVLAFLGSTPVYAIVVKDSDGNILLFRREEGTILLGSVRLTEELEMELDKVAQIDGKIVSFARILIDQDTYEKIIQWTDLERDDIEKLFLPQNQVPLLTDDEYSIILKLLRALRRGTVSLRDVQLLINKNQKSK